MDGRIFEQISSSLQNIKDKSDNADFAELIDLVAQMNNVLQQLFDFISIATKNQSIAVEAFKAHQDLFDTIGEKLVVIFNHINGQTTYNSSSIPIANQDSNILNELSDDLNEVNTTSDYYQQHLEIHDKYLETHDVHFETNDNHLEIHDKHLESHDKHLETHDNYLKFITQQLELLNRRK